MDQALANALKKRKQLEDELERLDQFIDMYHELSGGVAPAAMRAKPLPPEVMDAEILPDREHVNMLRPRGRPADFALIMEAILEEVGKPLQRGELVEEVEKRGHSIPSEDKPRYLGTILWRHEKIFVNLEKRGYWLRALPVPPEDNPDLLGQSEPTPPGVFHRRV